MKRAGSPIVALLLAAVVWAGGPAPGLTADEGVSEEAAEWHPIPFRVRDLTFPTVLVLGFMPRPNETLEPGRWALEFNYSASNNFQVSDDVESYLERRGGARRPLDRGDIDAMVSELEGNQFFVDGEFNLFDLGLHYGLSDRLTAAVRISYLNYGGGFLDSTIYNFHDAFGIGQAGRNFVSPDHFQLFYMNDGDTFVHLHRPTSGGFTDPVFSLSYTFPSRWRGWSFGIEGGIKVPLADEDVLLSSGGFDYGLQATAQKTWKKSSLVVSTAIVLPGEFEIGDGEAFDPPTLPSVNLTYLHRLGRRTTGIVQFFFSEHIFRDATDSDLSALEFQMVIGAKYEALGGIVGIGLTENLFNFDNTPDFGVHLSYAVAL